MSAAALSCSRTLKRHALRGFTMVEMIVVIVVTAIIAATLAVTIRPTIDAYSAVKGRADLTDQADAAMRRIVRDVRSAIPNSLRSSNTSCFELIPAKTGGRYRMAADAINDSPAGCDTPSNTCSAPLDPSQNTAIFDSLSTLSPAPAVGDWVVVNNQNSNDVYDGLNRSAITAISTPAPLASQGAHRITINSIQFSVGYDGGRFQVVDNNQKAVFFVCANTGLDASGNGTGTLYRLKNYGFNSSNGSTCPATTGGDVLATKIKSCSFLYNPNQGATQQSGFLAMDIEISRNNETAHLSVGAHVNNVP
jgi:MSHA biogenesis protein MshO